MDRLQSIIDRVRRVADARMERMRRAELAFEMEKKAVDELEKRLRELERVDFIFFSVAVAERTDRQLRFVVANCKTLVWTAQFEGDQAWLSDGRGGLWSVENAYDVTLAVIEEYVKRQEDNL